MAKHGRTPATGDRRSGQALPRPVRPAGTEVADRTGGARARSGPLEPATGPARSVAPSRQGAAGASLFPRSTAARPGRPVASGRPLAGTGATRRRCSAGRLPRHGSSLAGRGRGRSGGADREPFDGVRRVRRGGPLAAGSPAPGSRNGRRRRRTDRGPAGLRPAVGAATGRHPGTDRGGAAGPSRGLLRRRFGPDTGVHLLVRCRRCSPT